MRCKLLTDAAAVLTGVAAGQFIPLPPPCVQSRSNANANAIRIQYNGEYMEVISTRTMLLLYVRVFSTRRRPSL